MGEIQFRLTPDEFIYSHRALPDTAGTVFCPTRQRASEGDPITIVVPTGKRRPPINIYGKIISRQRGVHSKRIRAGLHVAIHGREADKVKFVADLLVAKPDYNRRHQRWPVTWTIGLRVDTKLRPGTMVNVSHTGALISSVECQISDVVDVTLPDGHRSLARVVRHSRKGDLMGLKWLARDPGGRRRIATIIDRLLEAEVAK